MNTEAEENENKNSCKKKDPLIINQENQQDWTKRIKDAHDCELE